MLMQGSIRRKKGLAVGKIEGNDTFRKID